MTMHGGTTLGGTTLGGITSAENINDFEQYLSEHEELIAKFDSKVVGIRYYNGITHPKEMVVGIREPNNPYDRNAIRVDNLTGDKVGHISRDEATWLSKVMDGSNLVRIEMMVTQPSGTFNLPIQIRIYCCPEKIFWAKNIIPSWHHMKTHTVVKGKHTFSQVYMYTCLYILSYTVIYIGIHCKNYFIYVHN